VRLIKPDVLLFDLLYKGWDQETIWAIIRQMKRAHPETRILGFTAYPHLVDGARASGCDLVLEKDMGAGYQELHSAIVSLANRPRKHRVTFKDLNLTGKEIEACLAMVKAGSIQEAARSRVLSLNTQKAQETEIRRKLSNFTGEEVHNRARAISLVLRLGLVDEEEYNPPHEGA
jgi:hypothetical protein